MGEGSRVPAEGSRGVVGTGACTGSEGEMVLAWSEEEPTTSMSG